MWVVEGVTAGQQAGVMWCREHGCVDVCVSVVGVVDGPTARAVRSGMWLLSVMTVTMVVGVCMVCACVLGVCALACARVCLFGLGGGGVCCLGCVDAGLIGADLDWSTGRRGRVDWCGVTTGCRAMCVSARWCMTGGK